MNCVVLFLAVRLADCFHILDGYDGWINSTNKTVDSEANTTTHRDSDVEISFKIIAYILVISLAFFGNLIVIFIILKTKSLRTKFNIYFVNLAVADMAMPTICMWIHLVNSDGRYWKLGEFLCKTHNFFNGKTASD